MYSFSLLPPFPPSLPPSLLPIPPSTMQVMNELVVDRGPHSYLCNLELYCNGRFMTSVQGDGEWKLQNSTMCTCTCSFPLVCVCVCVCGHVCVHTYISQTHTCTCACAIHVGVNHEHKQIEVIICQSPTLYDCLDFQILSPSIHYTMTFHPCFHRVKGHSVMRAWLSTTM